MLTPADRDTDRRRRLGEAGMGLASVGRYDAALTLCRQALEGPTTGLEPVLRSRVVKALVSIEFWGGHPEEAIQAATVQAEELAGIDPAAPFDIFMLTAFFHCTTGNQQQAMALAAALVDLAVTPRQELVANLTVDHMTVVYGVGPSHPDAGVWRDQLLEEGPGVDLTYTEFAQLMAPEIWFGELESCWERMVVIEAEMREQGSIQGLPYMLAGQSDLAWRMGRYQVAEALAYQAEELGDLIGDPIGPMLAPATLIKVAAVRGDATEAHDRLSGSVFRAAGPCCGRPTCF